MKMEKKVALRLMSSGNGGFRTNEKSPELIVFYSELERKNISGEKTLTRSCPLCIGVILTEFKKNVDKPFHFGHCNYTEFKKNVDKPFYSGHCNYCYQRYVYEDPEYVLAELDRLTEKK